MGPGGIPVFLLKIITISPSSGHFAVTNVVQLVRVTAECCEV